MSTNRFKEHKIAALIVAAGVGNRCDTTILKQYIKLADKPVLFHTIQKFLASKYIDYIRVVINKDYESFYREVSSFIIDAKLLEPVYGGESRKDSAKLGLESLQEIHPDFVIIHDACRPFVSNILIDKLVEYVGYNNEYTGVVPAIEVEDTVSLVNGNSIESTICRKKLRAIQTPQIFNFKELLSYHQSTDEKFTDDSSLVIENKKHVAVIQGEKSNLKLTTEEDVNMAKLLFEEPKFRVGTGYDIHRFIKIQNDTKCFIKICGAEIEHDMGVEAHSDGDVGIHAIVDAILGALGCGDIGEHFPHSSLQWKDCNSFHFLNFAAEKAQEKGYGISNLDVTIVCETPKISLYKVEMKKFISEILEIDDKFVNIKATTTEKLGSIGREEGIAAHAIVLLYKI
ncbi:MAG: 2-C-methyl-D-erythritol 2,4-cyclodiphosphate synthase [Wolbachia sp.]|nr:2-C-methyl-D-erythritol 2,4-cyclodiphosphate synthase [Wolbachia sp.]MDD9335963.1 2-C-methyl-D-erythritol 2,4-cyclodiphosphate synthase [Wolbachia sp.]